MITIDGDVCGAGDGRRSDVLDGDVLDAIIGVTTGIGSDPGAFDDVIIGAGTVDDVIVKRDIGVGVTVVGSGGDTGRIGRGILLAAEGNIGRAGDGRCADVLNGNGLDALNTIPTVIFQIPGSSNNSSITGTARLFELITKNGL